ncbi:unnamed protein product [Caenorhabditis angaria]|uniref:Uncharacterized protein n=1 Tax=Caenorhabditis angaria TaxID=860376 RepID=A0A9P1IEU7_9PELO|nr:unnamed protein product [Caenorhabditis angaria]
MPKGGSCAMLPVTAGVADDLSRLLRVFIAGRKYQHADFKELFKRMNMVTIFNGRDYSAEIIEFNESLLAECVVYLEPYSSPQVKRCFEERLFGLYTIHTFFYLQQMDHVMKIRMDPDIYQHFNCFVEQCRIEGYLDAFACGAQLKRDKAFKIVAFVGYHDPVYHRNFDTETNLKKLPAAVNLDVPFANLRNLLKTDNFLLLDAMHEKYVKMKRDLGVKFDGPLENPVRFMEKDLEKLEDEYYEKNRVKDIVEEPAAVPESNRNRLDIKHQAYTSDVNFSRTRRHRNAQAVHNPSQMFDFINNNENPAKKLKKSETLMDLAAENDEKPEIPAEKPKKSRKAEISAKKSKKAQNIDEKPEIDDWPVIPPEKSEKIDEKPEIQPEIAGKTVKAQKSAEKRQKSSGNSKISRKSAPEAEKARKPIGRPKKSVRAQKSTPEPEIHEEKPENAENSSKSTPEAEIQPKNAENSSKSTPEAENVVKKVGRPRSKSVRAPESAPEPEIAPEAENCEVKLEISENPQKLAENVVEVKLEIEEAEFSNFEVKMEIEENEEAEYPGILKKTPSSLIRIPKIQSRRKSVQFAAEMTEIREFTPTPQLSPEYAQNDDWDFDEFSAENFPEIAPNPAEEAENDSDSDENPQDAEIGLKIDELRVPKIEEESPEAAPIGRFRSNSELNDWMEDDSD